MVEALVGQDWGRVVRAVRVNGLDTPWCYGDVVEVVTGARDALDVIIVPKARTARDVWWFDVLLTQLETKLGLTRRIGLEVLIEEAEGLANAAEIARSSDRLEAIIFGAGDLSASLHARVDGNFDPVGEYPGDFWHHARVQILAAARAAGIDAIDAPYPAYQDPEGYRRSATHASLLGYDGKWAIHPEPGPHRQRRVRPDRGRGAGRRGVHRHLPCLRGRGRGRHRAGRSARGRRPHEAGRQRAAQGRARRLRAGRDRERRRGRRALLPGRPVGHRQHRHPRAAGRDRASPPRAGGGAGDEPRQGGPSTPGRCAGWTRSA